MLPLLPYILPVFCFTKKVSTIRITNSGKRIQILQGELFIAALIEHNYDII